MLVKRTAGKQFKAWIGALAAVITKIMLTNSTEHKSVSLLSQPYHTVLSEMTFREKPFENIVGKGENAGNQHFLLFPKCFLPYENQIIIIQAISKQFSANVFNLDVSDFLAPLTEGQRAIVMALCPLSVRPPIHPFVCAYILKFFLQNTSPQKLLTGFLPNFKECSLGGPLSNSFK